METCEAIEVAEWLDEMRFGEAAKVVRDRRAEMLTCARCPEGIVYA